MNGILLPVLVTLAIQALASCAVFTPPVLAPAASAEVGVDAAAVGVVTSSLYLASAVAALLSGGFIERLGPMRASQAALCLAAAGMSLMVAAHPGAVLAGALLVGLGYGVVSPASSAILGPRTPEHLRAFVFSVKQTGVPVGGALAGGLLPLALALGGWRTGALAVAAACLLLALAVQPGRRATDAGRRREAPLWNLRVGEPLRLLWSRRALRDLALASFAYSGMQMCLGSYLVVLLHDEAGASLTAAGGALSVAMAGGFLGRLFWGLVADRWARPRRVLGGLGLGMALAAVAAGQGAGVWPWGAVLLLSFAFGATAVGWNGVYISEVTRIAPPGQAAGVVGASFALTYLGVFVLPLAVWVVVSLGGGYGAGFALVAALALWRGLAFFGPED